ncbi:melanoma-associated antigen B4-like [Grammomys surdaster]|uniref:melanoma-associated antigen B4-like n=1 Tax=Grammomys surdaster TaxID=491861 RepID=UPI00109F54B0|nr:melanoma-associated antigen B4-like [Grammomys surdaster]
MPRGHKSKARAREKRRQVQDQAQGLKDAEAKAAEKGESASCSDHNSGDAVASTSTAGFPQKSKSQGQAPTTTASKGSAYRRSRKSTKGPREESTSCSRVPRFNENPQNDLLTRKTGILMQYLLCKYKMKQPANKGEMLKVINRRFKEQLPEILKKASERIQLVFGLEVKEIKPNGGYYTLVSKLDPSVNGILTTSLPFPQNGLLMPLLGVIFLNGNRASEADIWEFLNILGIYDGKVHIIFGEPRKLITKDLVKEKYLVYQKEANSDPPSFEFLWGPRAHAETTKMKVLEFLAKVNETVPQAFPTHYEEALKDQEERAQAEAVRSPGTSAKDKSESKVTGVDSSCKDKAESKVTGVDSSCKDKAESKVTPVASSRKDKAKSKVVPVDDSCS